jgi:hypothetical protein
MVNTPPIGWDKRDILKINWWKENQISEVLDIPQDLRDYREKWAQKINLIDWVKKGNIIKVLDKIPIVVKDDADGSRLMEFKIWNKKYKILDPNLENYSDDDYKTYYIDNNSKTEKNDGWITGKIKCCVELWWMEWDNIEERRNQKLKEYVRQKQTEWFHIAKAIEIEDLLNKLGNMANIDNERDQIAMLMYLTWMDWTYWLSEGKNWLYWGKIKTRDNISFHPYAHKRWIWRGDPISLDSKCLFLFSCEYI